MTSPRTLHRQLTRASLLTTLAVLLLSAGLILAYEFLRTRDERLHDLKTQAEILSHVLAPALLFNDRAGAAQQLASLKQKPGLRAAAVYDARGLLFARFEAEGGAGLAKALPQPALASAPGSRSSGGELELTQAIVHDGERVGSIALRAENDVLDRLATYAWIQGMAIAAALGLALVVFGRLQKSVTAPLAAMAGVAQDVVDSRDWRLRAPGSDIREINLLVTTFNSMLAEVQMRTDDLEREMTERLRAEVDLRVADRRKDEFLATLAHELRNPLAPMTSALALLDMPQASGQVRANAIRMMQRQVRHLARLIDDLLDVSRITTGKLVLRNETLDLAEVLRLAVDSVEPLAVSRQQAYVAKRDDWAEGPSLLEGDSARLLQVFSNLLTNACRYTPPGGSIGCSLQLDAGWAVVTVSDNGIGIDPAMQARIFELFEQVDKSLERGNAGLGLGLTLARQLAEMHGGSISVHSEGLGRGARFIVRLPLAAAAGGANTTGEEGGDVPQ